MKFEVASSGKLGFFWKFLDEQTSSLT